MYCIKLIRNLLCCAIFLMLMNGGFSQTIDYGNNVTLGEFFEVNGVRLYYEIYGEGEPLVLLHGNGGEIAKNADRIEHYKAKYKVIAIDHRGHGKSTDTDVELSYTLMTDDISKLLYTLDLGPYKIWGQSDGGIIALLLAKEHPELVEKASGFGVNIRADRNAVHTELVDYVLKLMSSIKNESYKKKLELLANYPNIKNEELRSINVPFLLMCGDRDAIRLEHSIKIFENLPMSNLFVMPGATHFGSVEKKELFYLVLDEFFEKPFKMTSTIDLMINN